MSEICSKCAVVLDVFNVAKWDGTRRNGEIREDSEGKLWCQPCADKHDNSVKYLTDHENKPIPMNGEHPSADMFGTTIDEVDSYYVLPNEDIVHPINTDEYFVQVLKAELVRTGE